MRLWTTQGWVFVSPEAARFGEMRDFGCGSSKKGYVSSSASKTRVIDIADDSGMGFVSPDAARFGGRSDLGCGSSKKRYVSSAYTKTRVIDIADDDELTYASIISPHSDARDVDIPEEVNSQVLYPPNTKRQPGRRRKTRIPSTREIRAPKKKISKNRCGRETYTCVISPHCDARDVDIPTEVNSQVLYPPNTKRQPGRRRKTRIPSTGEIRAPKKKLSKNICGRCRGEGHNRTNCIVLI
ncbi:hypothetical protein F2Q68_00025923 [Brassica cretica]|uniref:Uncharacterized protein n=1 Tax=Brassica cretica TaxID=69181 RepID=A0A8S9IJK5_BRACR|nr:hypothetical protein F2Q68_00025923 [Brassica cretica]